MFLDGELAERPNYNQTHFLVDGRDEFVAGLGKTQLDKQHFDLIS